MNYDLKRGGLVRWVEIELCLRVDRFSLIALSMF